MNLLSLHYIKQKVNVLPSENVSRGLCDGRFSLRVSYAKSGY